MAESVLEDPLSIFSTASLLTFLVTFIAVKAGFYRSLSAAIYPRIPSFVNVLFVFLAYLTFHLLLFPFGVYLGLSLYAQAWVSPPWNISEDTQMWINCLSLWMSIPILWFLCRIFQPSALQCVIGSDTVETKNEWVYNLSLGSLTWLICYPIVFLLNLILSEVLEIFFHPPETDQVAVKLLKMTFSDPSQLAFYLLAIVLIVPIVEEFLFRGILQRWLSSKVGAWPGILIASLGFAALHYSSSQGLYNLELLPSLYLLSCYLGFLYERQRSLWAPIGLHMTFNLISATMLIFQG